MELKTKVQYMDRFLVFVFFVVRLHDLRKGVCTYM